MMNERKEDHQDLMDIDEETVNPSLKGIMMLSNLEIDIPSNME
jgi:hypothetical protein